MSQSVAFYEHMQSAIRSLNLSVTLDVKLSRWGKLRIRLRPLKRNSGLSEGVQDFV
jgi:hypothetical protein